MLKLNLVSIAFSNPAPDKLLHLMQNATGLDVNEILSALEKERWAHEETITKLTTISADFFDDGWMMAKINFTRQEAAELSSACGQILEGLKKFDTRKHPAQKMSRAYIKELYKSVMDKQIKKIEKITNDNEIDVDEIFGKI